MKRETCGQTLQRCKCQQLQPQQQKSKGKTLGKKRGLLFYVIVMTDQS